MIIAVCYLGTNKTASVMLHTNNRHSGNSEGPADDSEDMNGQYYYIAIVFSYWFSFILEIYWL